MRYNKIFKWFEFLVIAFLLLFFYIHGISSVPFHPDESDRINGSAMFEVFLHGDWHNPIWAESYSTLTQPPLTGYIIAIGRRLGGYQVKDLNQAWLWSATKEQNMKVAMPSPGLLWWSRFPMALLSAASVMGLFLLLRRTFGRLSAYIWIALSVLNTYLLTMLDRAKGETTMLAFESLSVWMGILFLSQIKRTPERWSWKAWVFLYLSGIFAGAAASGKLNGFSIVGAGLGAVLISLFWMKGSAWKKIILIIGSAAILSGSMFSVFVGLYPYLWPDPIRRTEKMFQERSNEMSTQQKLITDNQIDTLQKRIRVLPKRILNTYATLHFTRSWWVNFPLVLIGLAVAIKKSWLWFCRKNDSPGAFLFILGGLAAAAPVLITPLDWDRYYLLSVYFSTGLISVGFGWLVSIIWKQLCVKLPHHSFTMG